MDDQHVVPSVFLLSGFVCRTLSLKEKGRLLDLPLEILTDRNETSRLENWLAARPPPFKVRAEVIRQLKAWSSLGYLLDAAKSHAALVRRKEGVQADHNCEAVSPTDNTKVGLTPLGPTPFTEPRLLTKAETEVLGVVSLKATKSDDASIPNQLWDNRALRCYTAPPATEIRHALDVLRIWFHKVWVCRVYRDF
ncbi:hypothetical protein ACA910_014855 [Epithemia clementina (nom. ined.)]